MKKLIGSITLLLIAVMLVSCAGIGDGALIDNVQTEDQKANDDCVLTVYDTDGNGTYRARLGKEDMQELISLISTGEYDNYREPDSLNNSYIMVECEMAQEVSTAFKVLTTGYRIYSDDFVAEMNSLSSWMPGLWPLGKQEGIYARVIEIMNEANKDIARAESAAGFSFDSLIVRAGEDYEFKASDFEDLGCIGVRHLANDKKNNSILWIFTFDSCTEGEIRNIASTLRSIEGITLAQFDYFGRLA